MADVFISYSRKDIAFAHLLFDTLVARGLEPWIDWQDIPPSAVWLEEIYRAIESADTFVIILSPTSLNSDVCRKEIAHAERNNKRLIPIVLPGVKEKSIPASLSAINWVHFPAAGDNEFQQAFDRLQEAVTTDLERVRAHTRLQVKALEWERCEMSPSYLLRGEDLRAAELWLAGSSGKTPLPTPIQASYIYASRLESSHTQQRAFILVAAALLVVSGLAVYAWIQRDAAVTSNYQRATSQSNAELASTRAVAQEATAQAERRLAEEARDEAVRQAKISLSRQLANQSESLDDSRFDLSLLLSVEAAAAHPSDEAFSSLINAVKRAQPAVSVLHSPTGIGRIAVSTNGNLLAAAGEGVNIRLWQVSPELKLVHMFVMTYSVDGVTGLAFSPNSRYLAACNDNNGIVIWDTNSGEMVKVFHYDFGLLVGGIFFNPDGETLAAYGRNNRLTFWNIASGKIVREVNLPEGASTMTFDPTWKQAAAATGNGRILLSGLSGKLDWKEIPSPAGANILSLVFSPGGELLAGGDAQGSITLWDIAAGGSAGVKMEPHPGKLITQLAFSPDGTRLASSGWDGTVVIADLRQPAAPPLVLEGHTTYATSLAYFQSGPAKLVSADHGGRIIFWDLDQQGTELRYPTSSINPIRSLGVSRDGNRLFYAGGSMFSRWDMAAGKLTSNPLLFPNTEVFVNPDGTRLILINRNESTLTLVDAESGEPLLEPITSPAEGEPDLALVFSPDGQYAAAGGCQDSGNNCQHGAIVLWDLVRGKGTELPVDNKSDISVLAFSPDGQILAVGSWDKTVSLWDTSSRRLISVTPAGSEYISALAFSPDGKTLASGNWDGLITFWDGTSGRMIGQPTELDNNSSIISSLAFSPDGRLLACGDYSGGIHILDAKTVHALAGPLEGHQKEAVRVLRFTPDGRNLVSGGDDRRVLLWDPLTGQLAGEAGYGHSGIIRALAVSPDSRLLATGSEDNSVIIWDLSSGRLLTRLLFESTTPIDRLMFSPDGSTLVVMNFMSSQILVWDLSAGQASPRLFEVGEYTEVKSIAFSPDGRLLAGGTTDGEIHLWDVPSGKQVGNTLVVPEVATNINDLAFTQDGKTLISGSSDSRIIIWDIATQRMTSDPLVQPVEPGVPFDVEGVHQLFLLPDGKTLLTRRTHDYRVFAWDLEQGLEQDYSSGDSQLYLSSYATLSPNGRWLVTGNRTGLLLFNAITGQPVPASLPGYPLPVTEAVFSPDGRYLIATDGATVAIGPGDISDLLDIACQMAGRNLAPEEWSAYIFSGSYHKTCPAWPIHFWELDALIERVHQDAENDVSGIMEEYKQVAAAVLESKDPNLMNNLCWYGATDGFVETVMPACEQAVAMAPSIGAFSDSRGQARALLGNLTGAAEDFTRFIEWTIWSNFQMDLVPKREEWIHNLQEGINPLK